MSLQSRLKQLEADAGVNGRGSALDLTDEELVQVAGPARVAAVERQLSEARECDRRAGEGAPGGNRCHPGD